MNAKSMLAATALVLLGSTAGAADNAPASGLTRAEVRAELLRARAAGELPSPADVYGPALTQAFLMSNQTVASQAAAKARTATSTALAH
jgi:hypothetical protein